MGAVTRAGDCFSLRGLSSARAVIVRKLDSARESNGATSMVELTANWAVYQAF
jgi:hypothetical protein